MTARRLVGCLVLCIALTVGLTLVACDGAGEGSAGSGGPSLPTDGDPSLDDPSLIVPEDGATLMVPWTLGDITCEQLFIGSLEARALNGETVVKSATATCPSADSQGSIAITGVAAGTYEVEIEGFDTLGEPRFIGASDEPVTVDRAEVSVDTVRIGPKPATMLVSWVAPSGGCVESGITDIELELLDASFAPLDFESVSTGCETGGVSQVSDEPVDGALSLEVDPADQMIVRIWGLDAEGIRVAKGARAGVDLGLGDHIDLKVTLKKCPEQPCGED